MDVIVVALRILMRMIKVTLMLMVIPRPDRCAGL
jgi:hypothetical protein